MIVEPFNLLYCGLLAGAIAVIVGVTLLLRRRSEHAKSVFVVCFCAVDIVLYFVYKELLSVDPGFAQAAGIDKFNWFNELPLQLCNINMFLIPIGVLTKKRPLLGFSFFLAPIGAAMALLFPEPAFTGYSLLLPRIFGYYITHLMVMSAGIFLGTLGFFRPRFRDFPGVLQTFVAVAFGAHLVNILLRATVCDFANYFFTFGGEISVLQLFWKLIPIPFLYELPALVILLGYMTVVTLLCRLFTRRSDNEPAEKKEKEEMLV